MIMIQATGFAFVGRVVIATVWLSHGQEKDCGAIIGEPIMVAVGGIVSWAYLACDMAFVIH